MKITFEMINEAIKDAEATIMRASIPRLANGRFSKNCPQANYKP